jgi:hypothetical protein
MKTRFAEDRAFVKREGGIPCRQGRNGKMLPGTGGCCEHAFVTELCILRGCKNIGVRLLEEKHTGNCAEKRAANASGVTQQERDSLAGS